MNLYASRRYYLLFAIFWDLTLIGTCWTTVCPISSLKSQVIGCCLYSSHMTRKRCFKRSSWNIDTEIVQLKSWWNRDNTIDTLVKYDALHRVDMIIIHELCLYIQQISSVSHINSVYYNHLSAILDFAKHLPYVCNTWIFEIIATTKLQKKLWNMSGI